SAVLVNPAAASRLTIAQQPSSTATAGVAFAQQPVVRVEDQFGNLIATDSSSSISATRLAGAGVLQGTTSITVIGGVATFGNLSHNVSTNITIQFTSGALTAATSGTVSIFPGPATRLTIQTQPSTTAIAGFAFAQQPVVRIEDAFGNLRTNDNATIVTAARNGGSGILQGTTVRTAAGGVIAYSGLFHTVATNITIDFTSPGLTLATSTSIAISPTTADRFVFAVEPANGVAGAVLGTQPVGKS